MGTVDTQGCLENGQVEYEEGFGGWTAFTGGSLPGKAAEQSRFGVESGRAGYSWQASREVGDGLIESDHRKSLQVNRKAFSETIQERFPGRL